MKRRFLPLALMAVLALGAVAAGCGEDEKSDSKSTSTATASEDSMEKDAMEEDAMAAEKNIVETAQATPDLSTLVAAVTAADLGETLSGDGPFTVFAPTNAAFEALPAGTLDDLLKPENKDKLASILTYHVVASEAMSTDLSDGQKIKTVNGEELTVSIKGDKVMIDGATVAQADIKTSNGVVHVIDAVMLPKG